MKFELIEHPTPPANLVLISKKKYSFFLFMNCKVSGPFNPDLIIIFFTIFKRDLFLTDLVTVDSPPEVQIRNLGTIPAIKLSLVT